MYNVDKLLINMNNKFFYHDKDYKEININNNVYEYEVYKVPTRYQS